MATLQCSRIGAGDEEADENVDTLRKFDRSIERMRLLPHERVVPV